MVVFRSSSLETALKSGIFDIRMTFLGFGFKRYDLKQQIIKVAIQCNCFRLVAFSTALFYISFDM